MRFYRSLKYKVSICQKSAKRRAWLLTLYNSANGLTHISFGKSIDLFIDNIRRLLQLFNDIGFFGPTETDVREIDTQADYNFTFFQDRGCDFVGV